MQVFFSVLRDMIFCGEQDLIDFMASFSISDKSKNNGISSNNGEYVNTSNTSNSGGANALYLKPYFSYIDIMRNELVKRTEKLARHSKDFEDSFADYKMKIQSL